MRPKRHERNGQYENFNNAASLPETLLGIEKHRTADLRCDPLTTLRMTATRQGSALQLNTAHSEERFFNPIIGNMRREIGDSRSPNTEPTSLVLTTDNYF